MGDSLPSGAPIKLLLGKEVVEEPLIAAADKGEEEQAVHCVALNRVEETEYSPIRKVPDYFSLLNHPGMCFKAQRFSVPADPL